MTTTTPNALTEGLDAIVEPDAPLAGHTWFGVGGRADLLVRPRSEASLKELLRRCHDSNLPLRVLGSGANLLVLEEGVDGVVVKLDQPAFTQWTLNADGNANMVMAPAGVDVSKLMNACVKAGLDGLCPMWGIPASMGGATRMNAGGKFGCIGDAIHSVATMNERGEVRVHPHRAIQFSYRHSSLPQELILWSLLQLTPGDPDELRKKVVEISHYKKNSQPLADNSAGCLFRNPLAEDGTRTSAGKLIDLAGLKGFAHGSAFVSPEHANFICVNKGGLAGDVFELARIVQQKVRQRHGVEIEMEVAVWGRSINTMEKS
ncbi:MAG: UDP-N-acetylmuramate dehydrogenase [Planctomycetes bacterium]|nr:UDP-N-acetylmuramate dehydrogenase [Planctomycetota bacterium]